MIAELLLEMEAEPPSLQSIPRGLYTSPLTQPLKDAAVRLLECLESPADSKVLGPQFVREIVYRVLQASKAMCCAPWRQGSHFAQISRVLDHLHRDYAKPIDVESLARAGQNELFHLLFEIQGRNGHVASSIPQERSAGQGASSDDSGWLHGQAAAFAVGYESVRNSAGSTSANSASVPAKMQGSSVADSAFAGAVLLRGDRHGPAVRPGGRVVRLADPGDPFALRGGLLPDRDAAASGCGTSRTCCRRRTCSNRCERFSSGGPVSWSGLLWSLSLSTLYIFLSGWLFTRIYGHAVCTGLIARCIAETLS